MARGGLQPLTRAPLLHVSVQQSLKQFIADNNLGDGDALPPESGLARALGVSRNSVREAVKALESVGILETRRGIGVFVRPFSLEPLLEHLTYGFGRSVRDVAEVLEIRRTLEVAMIERAISRLDQNDLAGLHATLDAMRARAECGEGFPEEDRAFHSQLFCCLDNRVMLRLIDVFWLAFHRASGFFDSANPAPMVTWQEHVDILAAVEARDPVAARARLDHHYRHITTVLATRDASPK
jgi:DNA-binding FadR family transcriptional regulator